jgi:hypothetical protein
MNTTQGGMMLRKTLMITIYLMIGFQAKAAICTPHTSDRAPASEQQIQNKPSICMIDAGDVGKLKYKASSYEQAFSRVTDECFQRRTNLFVKREGTHPDQDRQIQFAESCVNSIKCI